MIGVKIKLDVHPKRIKRAVDKAAFRNFGHAAARIRKDAMESIENAPDRTRAKTRKGRKIRGTHTPSRPGQPPYTQRGAMRRAIIYDATKQDAIIGPRSSVVGESAQAHELGGVYKGQSYPARPFMQPALEKNLGRFHREWAGSVT